MKIKINWLQIIALIIIALIIVAALSFSYLYYKERAKLKNVQIELAVKTQETKQLLDSNGKLFARVDEYKKTTSELKNAYDSIERKLYKEARLNGIKSSEIAKLQYALMTTKDSINTELKDSVVIIESVKYDKYGEFNNKYLDAKVYIAADSMKAELDYTYTIELYMTDSWLPRKFFLWRWFGMHGKTQRFDFKCSDPNASVKVLRSINVND